MAAKAKPLKKLVVIEDGTLTSMANNKKFLTAFPFLSAIQKKPKKSKCSRCGSNTSKRASVFTSVKRALAGMGSAQKRKLKELLNTEKARIIYRNERDKVMELTF